eukprot:TRINITY_DN32598_c0_g1_i1.p1 TRINITY_DN32598_c0_g1~~TRINITY_DN32598_c0_g1_i1.p1  ORF type:complete len:593 (+),score=187.10 TRINITY_DN32598_c0_g1_i1:73-1851(+)
MARDDLFEWARQGNLPALEHALATCPARARAVGDDGGTLLHAACREQHVEVVEFLVSAGAKVNAKDGRGRPAAHYAVGGQADGEAALLLCRILRHAGARLFAPAGEEQETLLHRAARYGHVRVVKYLYTEIAGRPGLRALRGARDGATTGSGPSLDMTTTHTQATPSMYSDDVTATATARGDRSMLSLSMVSTSEGDSASAVSDNPSRGGVQRDARREKKRRRLERRRRPEYTPQQFVDLRNARGETALFLAARGARYATIEFLLSVAASVALRTEAGQIAMDTTRLWAATPHTSALKAKLRPPPPPPGMPDGQAMPVLVFTPCGASSPRSIPTSPPGRRDGGTLEQMKAQLAARSPGRRAASEEKPLTPVVDLMLEFARDEAEALRADKEKRLDAMRRLNGIRSARMMARTRTGARSASPGRAADAAPQLEESDSDTSSESSGVFAVAPGAQLTKEREVHLMAPYYRVLHVLSELAAGTRRDLAALKAAVDDTHGKLKGAVGESLENASFFSDNTHTQSTFTTARAQFMSAPIRNLVCRVAELEHAGGHRQEGQHSDLPMVLQGGAAAYIAYTLFSLCAVFLSWAGWPTAV